MKTDFYYSTDFNGINCAELCHTCLHLRPATCWMIFIACTTAWKTATISSILN